MPIKYRVDETEKLAIAVITGDINPHETPMLLRQIQVDGIAKDVLVLLKDTRVRSSADYENARSAIEFCTPDADAYRTAVVAPSDSAFRLMRLYHSYRLGAVERSRIFQDIRHATWWLGLKDEPEIDVDDPEWQYIIDTSPAETHHLHSLGSHSRYLPPFSRNSSVRQ